VLGMSFSEARGMNCHVAWSCVYANLQGWLLAELQGTPAPLRGFSWIGFHAMHAMMGEGLCLECFRQPDGSLRKAKIEGTREVLACDRNISIGQMAIAQPHQALRLCARGLVKSLGWCSGGGRRLGRRIWPDRDGHFGGRQRGRGL